MRNKYARLWFLFGLGSNFQILASLSVTEAVILLVAPFYIFGEIPYMKRTGVFTFWCFSIALFIGCCISLVYNRCDMFQIVRGLSVTGLLMLTIPVVHGLLRRAPAEIKWMFLGSVLSLVLCTFIFQRAVEVAEARGDVDAVTGTTLYWVKRLGAILRLPALMDYLKTPIMYTVSAPVFMAGFAVLTTTSGRASALCALSSSVIAFVGGKTRSRIRKIGKHFFAYGIVAILGIIVFKFAYQKAALSGMLGEKQYQKYLVQTKGDDGIVKLIIGGRASSFMGYLAIADSPIFGRGYWAEDDRGYNLWFINRYGNEEDYERMVKSAAYKQSHGFSKRRLIQCHSHLTSFWLWYGIAGLIFWLYVMHVMVGYIKKDASYVPQWFFWLAGGMPSLVWDIFFSPFMARTGLCVYVCAMLLCRAVRLGRYQLPMKMIREIEETERKR